MKPLYECRLKCRLPQLVNALAQNMGETPKINHIEKRDLPSRKRLLDIQEDMLSLLYPGYRRHDLCNANLHFFIGDMMDRLFVSLRDEISKALMHEADANGKEADIKEMEVRSDEMTVEFLDRIPKIRNFCATDVEAAFSGDPAAATYTDIVFSYPGFHAVSIYRLAHELNELGVPLIPRFMTETAHHHTGIDIHPGAQIAEGFFIDHGTGVVIGETTIIGKRVQMYHGVTLGAFSPRKGQELRGVKRHPTIEDNVTIYPNATILGGETVVGEGSVIGGNVWLTQSVPPGSKVYIEQPAPRIRQKED
ncbi:MAG: serine O-acetyltransferase EpsC [Candidatus Sumerlaeota bacterium]